MTVSTLHRTGSGQSQKPLHPLTQLRAFLGMVNYYSKFLPWLSSVLAPLYRLLQKATRWSLGPEEDRAFQTAKCAKSSSVLTYYNPAKELFLNCDSSPYGVGAILSHRMADRSMKPITYASRSLNPTEKRYSRLNKEGLAIVFGFKNFHHYLFGKKFTICSDHKPLQHSSHILFHNWLQPEFNIGL